MLSAVTALGWFCLGLSGVVIAVLLLVFVLKRLLGWLDDLGYITYTGHVPTWAAWGMLPWKSRSSPNRNTSTFWSTTRTRSRRKRRTTRAARTVPG